MARPKKKIDSRQVYKLAKLFCTTEEIASIVGCSKDTLERRFAAALKDGREFGKCSLKRKQFERAMNGNTTMLIWLGKQYLHQSDKQEVTGAEGGPITTTTTHQFDYAAYRDLFARNRAGSAPENGHGTAEENGN